MELYSALIYLKISFQFNHYLWWHEVFLA